MNETLATIPESHEAIRQQVRENRIYDRVRRGFTRAKAEEAQTQVEESMVKMREGARDGALCELIENKGFSRKQAEVHWENVMLSLREKSVADYKRLQTKHPKRFAELEIETRDRILGILVDMNFPPQEVAVATVVTTVWHEEQRAKRQLRSAKRQLAELATKLEKDDPTLLAHFKTSYSAEMQRLAEAQLRPEVFPVLRVLVDREPLPARFLLLGSASPELVKGVSESLASRVACRGHGRVRLWRSGAAEAVAAGRISLIVSGGG